MADTQLLFSGGVSMLGARNASNNARRHTVDQRSYNDRINKHPINQPPEGTHNSKDSIGLRQVQEPTLARFPNGITSKSIVSKHSCATNERLTEREKLTTIDVFGQLGNNMFQYAGLLGVSKMNNRSPFIKTGSNLIQYFSIDPDHIKNIPNTVSNHWKLIDEPRYATYDRRYECLPPGPVLLQCYFQSFKYFQNISHVIRREFVFSPKIQRLATEMLKGLQRHSRVKNSTVIKIGVHIRRGDKLTNKEMRSGERVAPISYFTNAFHWMRDKYTNVLFLVASDDTRWTKTHIVKGNDIILLPNGPGVASIHAP